MFRKPNPSSGIPIYVQLKEQIRHAIETGALSAGDQLPGIRGLAETLVINPNTVAKVYRELEHEGVIELRHGAGAFVSPNARAKKLTDKLRAGQAVVAAAVDRLRSRGITDEDTPTPTAAARSARLWKADPAWLDPIGRAAAE